MPLIDNQFLYIYTLREKSQIEVLFHGVNWLPSRLWGKLFLYSKHTLAKCITLNFSFWKPSPGNKYAHATELLLR